MRHSALLAILLLLALTPGVAVGQAPSEDQHLNVNSRYVVDGVSVSGISESAVSRTLWADIQKLVGERFDQERVNRLAERLREELGTHSVAVKTARADKTERVRVTFEVDRQPNALYLRTSPLVYHSIEGVSARLGFGFDTHHNFFSFAWTSTADELLERNEGYRLRYEHRRVGTDAVRIRLDFDRFHPSFEAPVEDALSVSPAISGTYRRRQQFAPSVSVLPAPGVKFGLGLSLQSLDLEVPTLRTERAFAFTADAELQRRTTSEDGYRHEYSVGYSQRRATAALESDFVYTRHLALADYSLSRSRHLVGVHGRLGTASGTLPLFERFTLGTSALLRGWNKFDVAPLGGSRLAYGSLEYRYRPFQVFYDFGSVWDADRTAKVRHSVGIGLVSRNGNVGGWFLSLAFPVRLHDVGPVVMFGIRP